MSPTMTVENRVQEQRDQRAEVMTLVAVGVLGFDPVERLIAAQADQRQPHDVVNAKVDALLDHAFGQVGARVLEQKLDEASASRSTRQVGGASLNEVETEGKAEIINRLSADGVPTEIIGDATWRVAGELRNRASAVAGRVETELQQREKELQAEGHADRDGTKLAQGTPHGQPHTDIDANKDGVATPIAERNRLKVAQGTQQGQPNTEIDADHVGIATPHASLASIAQRQGQPVVGLEIQPDHDVLAAAESGVNAVATRAGRLIRPVTATETEPTPTHREPVINVPTEYAAAEHFDRELTGAEKQSLTRQTPAEKLAAIQKQWRDLETLNS